MSDEYSSREITEAAQPQPIPQAIGAGEPAPRKIIPVDFGELDTTEDSNRGADLELMNPYDANVSLMVFIPMLGRDSDAVSEHVANNVNRKIRLQHQAQKRGKDGHIPSVQTAEQEQVELLAVAIIASGRPWYMLVQDEQEPKKLNKVDHIIWNGAPMEWNLSNVKKFLTERKFARRQADEFLNDLENFKRA